MSENALKKSAKHIFKQFLFFNDFKKIFQENDAYFRAFNIIVEKIYIHILLK